MNFTNRMDILECYVCKVPYDEDGHRPRNAPCRHDICSSCARALIKDRIFECPKCREKHKVDNVEDLQVNYGLAEVIQAFKSGSISMTKETGASASAATSEEVCRVHGKSISHWCSNCQLWICVVCIESHNSMVGCSTTTSTKAMESMKEKSLKDIKPVLSMFDGNSKDVSAKIQEHTDKIKEHNDKIKAHLEKVKEHEDDVQKLRSVIEKGKVHKENLNKQSNILAKANSPNAVREGVNMMTQSKQDLHSWCVKNMGSNTPLDSAKNKGSNTSIDSAKKKGMNAPHDLAKNIGSNTSMDFAKALKEAKDVHTEISFKSEKLHSKLSHHAGRICIHPFKKQAVAASSILWPFPVIQKMIPGAASLMFLEFSLGSVVKGLVSVRLDKNLPRIREYMISLATGQQGAALSGVDVKYNADYMFAYPLSQFKDLPVTPETGSGTAKQGDVLGHFGSGYLNGLLFYVAAPHKTRDCRRGSYRVVGSVEVGLDIVLECHSKHSTGVKISDSGLIIE